MGCYKWYQSLGLRDSSIHKWWILGLKPKACVFVFLKNKSNQKKSFMEELYEKFYGGMGMKSFMEKGVWKVLWRDGYEMFYEKMSIKCFWKDE